MTARGIERRVLFVCTDNAGRSIAAAVLLNAHYPPGVRADSAGTDPTHVLNPTVVAALAERGISLAGVDPKPITTELLATGDLVITMSRDASGPILAEGAGPATALAARLSTMAGYRCTAGGHDQGELVACSRGGSLSPDPPARSSVHHGTRARATMRAARATYSPSASRQPKVQPEARVPWAGLSGTRR